MLVDFVVHPYFKRIFVLSEVYKQSDISTILASSVQMKQKEPCRLKTCAAQKVLLHFCLFQRGYIPAQAKAQSAR